jgi:hypothetical protein
VCGSAVQAYHGRNFDYTKNYSKKMVSLGPSLAENNGQRLADIFCAWIARLSLRFGSPDFIDRSAKLTYTLITDQLVSNES